MLPIKYIHIAKRKVMKNKIKNIHFVGIGGSGMSGIAEVMHNLKFNVQGSDLGKSEIIERLKKIGIKVFSKHSKKNIKQIDVLVVSTAISNKNSEVKAAIDQKIPIIQRAEMLSELMRFKKGIAVAGTHGKTTTTSLIASILTKGKLDPTYVIGGKLNSMNSNAKLGTSDLMIVEADESDASFFHLSPVNAIITNIDNDHLGTYQNKFENLKQAYIEFAHQVPFYGTIFICADDRHVKSIISRIARPIVTYGLSSKVDIQAVNIKYDGNKVNFRVIDKKYNHNEFNISINFPGDHFIRNTLAAISIALEYRVSIDNIQKSLANFEGVSRRYEIYNKILVKEKTITVIDDYGHHPTEIEAVIKATKKRFRNKKINLVFQPHRFSRTKDCFEEFIRVLKLPDRIFLFDIYSAGESKVKDISTKSIMNSLKHPEMNYLADFKNAKEIILNLIEDDSILIIMGAGSIGNFAQEIIEQ
jgi:UDP-N-acetylmuramate--alanine ligase